MGSVNIDNTGSGADVTLSSDGTDLLLDGTAIGGGPTFYAETFTATDPLPTANGTSCFAIGAYSQANAFGTIALGYDVQAGSLSSTSIGRNSSGQGSRTATGHGAMALGGSRASGTDSFAAAIGNNTSSYGATGANSIAIGKQAKAQGSKSFAVGSSARAVNAESTAIGDTAIAQGTKSIALGVFTTANGTNSVSLGHYSKAEQAGKFAYGSGRFTAQGDAQGGQFILRSDTTDATPEALTTNNSAAGTDDQVILPNNSAYAFHGTIVARQKAGDGTASAAWKVEGLIRREGSAGTTVLVNSATTVLDNTPGWGMALSADTTNGGLAITATGAASTNIRWVATIHTTEVTYA